MRREKNPLLQYNPKAGKALNANITLQSVLDIYEKNSIDKHMELTQSNLSKYARNKANIGKVKMLNHYFFDLLDVPVKSMNSDNIRMWAVEYMNSHGIKAATVNRAVSGLRGMLHWAADHSVIDEYRLVNFKQVTDGSENDSKLRRCLTQTEIKHLIAALEARERHKRDTRDSYNKHRAMHHLDPCPVYPETGKGYADYVYPMILTSLLTGGRKGSVRALRWKDVDFKNNTIVFQGENSKSGNTVIVPMTTKLADILRKWKRQNNIDEIPEGGERFVFTAHGRTLPLDPAAPRCWKEILASAKISNFRWHDMRHTYASLLVQNGADIVTIKELLGHSDIKTTSIYLHSSIQQMRKSVKKLDNIISM